MINKQLYIPSFRQPSIISRTIISLVMVAVFLAVFEVGLTNQGTFTEFFKQFYFHCFFLLISGFLILGVYELVRHRIDPLPRQQAWLRIMLITISMLCLSTIFVNVIHHVTGMQSWQVKGVLLQLLFHSLLGVFVVAAAGHYINLQHLLLQRHSADLQSHVYNLESRMKPHFFFNAMNSLLYLVESKDDKAASLVEDMAAFFRVSLRAPHQVSLKQEIDTCQRYINIEQLRLGDQFHMVWDLPNPHELHLPQIPSLSLQPIFEYLITEGTQHVPPLKVHLSARLLEDETGVEGESVEVFWHVPRIDDDSYVRELRALLNKVEQQLVVNLGDKVQLFLQAGKQNHTIGLIYPINSVI